ncbi:MAG: 5-oxoprolinase subunit PxpB [Rhodanobacteraceae bacterium]
MIADFTAEPLAEDALLLRFGDGIGVTINALVHDAATRLRAAGLPGVSDIAPAYASLLLRFDPLVWNDPREPAEMPHARLLAAVRQVLRDAHGFESSNAEPTRIVEIPVCYGGESGADLEAVAAHARLDIAQVIARHAAAEYTVAMLGFAPGFPYLLGLDPALHAPRRATPRNRVPAGSVAIGGAQTGIYPRELPGGWNLIGRTSLVLFDARRDPSCLLAPGMRVRFRAIDAGESTGLVEKCGEGQPLFDPRDQG